MVGYWDPMGLADVPLWNQDEEAVIGARRRACTLRGPADSTGVHARCAARVRGGRRDGRAGAHAVALPWQAGCATLRSSTVASRWLASWATACTRMASNSPSPDRRASVRPNAAHFTRASASLSAASSPRSKNSAPEPADPHPPPFSCVSDRRHERARGVGRHPLPGEAADHWRRWHLRAHL